MTTITLSEVRAAVSTFEAYPYPMSAEHARLRDLANAAIDQYASENDMTDAAVIAAVKNA